ncbi:hypothetical protein HanPI659440_Chr10g0384341 [Helianthus annuus]|nr:hypothetical protein HanPI659440_Chr10g0384341 [Helianthus annuus]
MSSLFGGRLVQIHSLSRFSSFSIVRYSGYLSGINHIAIVNWSFISM